MGTQEKLDLPKVMGKVKDVLMFGLSIGFFIALYRITCNLWQKETGVSFEYLAGAVEVPSLTICPASIVQGKGYPMITRGQDWTMKKMMETVPSLRRHVRGARLRILKDFEQ